jgi:hypothetical protein
VPIPPVATSAATQTATATAAIAPAPAFTDTPTNTPTGTGTATTTPSPIGTILPATPCIAPPGARNSITDLSILPEAESGCANGIDDLS